MLLSRHTQGSFRRRRPEGRAVMAVEVGWLGRLLLTGQETCHRQR
jgi:hypothetical protein